ncbi:MAG: hypothetical protein R2942_16305 [Ignavibacteria bacterium]
MLIYLIPESTIFVATVLPGLSLSAILITAAKLAPLVVTAKIPSYAATFLAIETALSEQNSNYNFKLMPFFVFHPILN